MKKSKVKKEKKWKMSIPKSNLNFFLQRESHLLKGNIDFAKKIEKKFRLRH